MRLEIRAVSPNEAAELRALRLRGLEESSEAFGTGYIAAGFQPFGREVDALRQNGVSDTMEYLALRLRPGDDTGTPERSWEK